MQSFIARQTELRVLLRAAIAFAWAFSAGAAQAEALRLITDVDPASFESKGNGKGPGVAVEVLRQVLATLGQDVSLEYFPSTRGWSMIARGERDGMSAVVRTSAREQICAFPDEPLIRDESVLFVRTADIGKLKFSSLDDLVGHNVAVNQSFVPGSSEHPGVSPELEKFLRAHHNMTETNGNSEGLRMLAAGRVDYAVMSLALGKREIRDLDLSGKIAPLAAHPVTERDINTCFTRGRVSPAFVAAFSNALKQFKQTDTFQEIRHKYVP